MPDYPNPYEFVPIENSQPSRAGWNRTQDGIERLHPERYTGRLHCVLHPETPIFIHDQGQQGQESRRFFLRSGKPGIPASSLKGAIRSVFEIVSDSCLSSLSEKYQAPASHIRTYRGGISTHQFDDLHPVYRAADKIAKSYRPCTTLAEACPSCRLFGMVEEGREAEPLAGRLFFSDGSPVAIQRITVRMPAAGGGPHPWHSPFYFQDEGRGSILGRKLYFHHRDYRETLRLYEQGGRPNFINLEGHVGDFMFSVDFVNLTEHELAYLTYALVLEPQIRHHLFYGKPYGLGCAQIRVQMEIHQAPDTGGLSRFLSLEAPALAGDPPEAWAGKGRDLWLARPGSQPAFDAFRRILAWPGRNLYKYPAFSWFRDTPGSGNVTLAEYQQGVRTKAARSAPATTQARPVTPASGKRERGVVESFERGFGFIRTANEQRVFVRFSEIQGSGYRSLNPGDEVEFEVRRDERGLRAYEVVRVSSGRQR